jgi:hypothetical protein
MEFTKKLFRTRNHKESRNGNVVIYNTHTQQVSEAVKSFACILELTASSICQEIAYRFFQ